MDLNHLSFVMLNLPSSVSSLNERQTPLFFY